MHLFFLDVKYYSCKIVLDVKLTVKHNFHMPQETVLWTEHLKRPTLLSAILSLSRLITPGLVNSDDVHIEDEDGWNLTGVALVERKLTDGSKVYNARLLFGSLTDSVAEQVGATERVIRSSAHANTRTTAVQDPPTQKGK